MSLTDLTPRSLIDALRGRCPVARDELARRLAGPVKHLCRSYAARHPDLVVSDELVARLLRWIEAHLIRLPAEAISRVEESPDPCRLFCLTALAAVTRLMLWEPLQDETAKISPGRVPDGVYILDEGIVRQTRDGQECPAYGKARLPDPVRELVRGSGYDVELYLQSRDAVGGDWVMIGPNPDHHGFWTIVADFSGKSWTAYVLKQCVCLAWNSPLGRQIEAPSALLQKLHAALLDKLPEGTFVELLASQFQSDGLTEIVSAGMGHVLALDAATGTVSGELLSAPLMGIDVGKVAVRQVWQTVFSEGDQVLLSTDGLYDQPKGSGRIGGSLVAEINSTQPVRDLHECVVKIVGQALEAHRQHDDLTLLTISRCFKKDDCGMGGRGSRRA